MQVEGASEDDPSSLNKKGRSTGTPSKRSKALIKSQKQIEKQNELITDAMRMGLDTHKLS